MQKIISLMIGFGLNMLSFIAPRKTGHLSLALFCRPLRPRLSGKQHRFLQQGNPFTVKYKGHHVQGYQWGNGPARVLFIHGWQSHTYRWKKYIEQFNLSEYTVYAFDAPGHGLSNGSFLSVPLYSEVIEHFSKQVGGISYIISHSLGAFSVMYTLFRLPEWKIKKLVVMGSPGEAQEFVDFYQKTLRLSDRVVRLTIAQFQEMFQRTPAFFSASRFVSSLSVDGLVIHDEEDRETSVENAIQIHKSWKNSTLLTTRGYGHNLKSPEVAQKVMQFIAENEHNLVAQENAGLRPE